MPKKTPTPFGISKTTPILVACWNYNTRIEI